MSIQCLLSRRGIAGFAFVALLATILMATRVSSPSFAQSPEVGRRPAAASVSTGELQALINAAATQFKIAYRHHDAELAARREQLAAAIEAWHQAPRTGANNGLFAHWLREVIRQSMPGAREPLPMLPDFNPSTQPDPPRSTTTTRQKPVMQTPAASGSVASETDADYAVTTPLPTADEVAPPTGDESSAPAGDFWSTHPAIGELPAELATGDPFKDDPESAMP
jgi:hypothetical protein